MAKTIQMHESIRLKSDQGMQDGMYGEPHLMSSPFGADAASKWHADLINAWETNLPSKMEEAIAMNLDGLEKSQMIGMARLMLQSLIQKKIRDLGATYLTLSFAEIAEKTQLPVDQLEAQITKMVQTKAITAKINKKQGTVDFIESEAETDSGALVNQTNFEMIKKIEN